MISEETLKAVQKMQEHIEANLQKSLSLRELAEVAGYSPFHAARLFKEHTGQTPFDYIRMLRLSQAAMVLRDGEERVVCVALEFLFASHEGFTRAFSRQFGLSPSTYRQKTPPIRLFMPDKVFDRYTAFQKGTAAMQKENQTKSIFVQVIERPARKVIVRRGIQAEDYYAYCQEVGCDVWAVLCSVKEALYEPIGMWLPRHLIPVGTSRYVQGVEVPADYDKILPEGFELISLPPCKMMIFQGEPYDDRDFENAISDLWSHIENFNPSLYGYRWAAEAGPRFQMEPQGFRGYIEGWPVEEIPRAQ